MAEDFNTLGPALALFASGLSRDPRAQDRTMQAINMGYQMQEKNDAKLKAEAQRKETLGALTLMMRKDPDTGGFMHPADAASEITQQFPHADPTILAGTMTNLYGLDSKRAMAILKAATDRSIAGAANQTKKDVAGISAGAQLGAARIGAGATRDAATTRAQASRDVAGLNNQGKRETAKIGAGATTSAAKTRAEAARDVAKIKIGESQASREQRFQNDQRNLVVKLLDLKRKVSTVSDLSQLDGDAQKMAAMFGGAKNIDPKDRAALMTAIDAELLKLRAGGASSTRDPLGIRR